MLETTLDSFKTFSNYECSICVHSSQMGSQTKVIQQIAILKQGKLLLGQNKGLCDTVALPFTLISILRQKKNYESSNISTCKSIIFKKKSPKRIQNASRYHNSITNLKFQHKPRYYLSKILI
jgi:hypothetical protein